MSNSCNNSFHSPAISENPITPSNADSPQPSSRLSSTTQRPRRTIAKRSCINCREKKTRCELPDQFVASSKQPVIDSKRCHRCKVLGIDCIVWDGNRKRKLNLPPMDEGSKQISPNKRTTSSPWGPLSHLADAAEVLGEIDIGLDPFSSSSASRSSLTPAPLNPSSRSSPPSSPLQNQTTYRASRRESQSSIASVASFLTDMTRAEIQQRAEILSKGPSNPQFHEESRTQANECIALEANKAATAFAKEQNRMYKSIWRTLSILVDHSIPQSQFISYLIYRVATPHRTIRTIDILDMITRDECLELSSCMSSYLPWHPHLPSLVSLYDRHNTQPERSMTFLLVSMFLVAARHRHSLSSTLMKGLSATVDRLGTQAILSSIRDIQVVQAFELLLAHEPSLVGTYNSGDESEQAQRAAGLAGESLLTNAISISKDLGLDKSIYELYKHLNNPQGKPQTNKISELLISSSLWLNLRIWDGHYVFFKPKNRVLRDLDDLARVSTCMIAIDELGNKLGTNSNSNVENFESNQKDKTENQLRAAGRTLLSHRIRAMAAIHGALSKITDILDFANDDEDLSQTHTSSQQKQPPTTTPQVKDEVVGAVLSVFEERYTIEQCMQMDMIHFTTLNSAHLAEEWVQLELNSNLSMLCTIGICSLYAGRADTGFTTKLFLEALQQDEKLRDCIALLGKNRLELSERVVSSFAFFNRRPTISSTASDAPKKTAGVIELTGAPYFLTCAFVVDACRLFLEGTAFVLVTYHSIQKNFDSRLLSMIQAAQRLEEFDGNRYCQVEGGDNPHNGTTKPPLSICQLGAKFIRDMIETLQKWKLSSSMHRKPELIGPWGDRKTSASRAHARINRDTPDNSTEDVGTPESTLYSSSPGPNHDSDTLTPRRKSTTQFAMMPNGHSLAPQPPGGALDMTIQSSNHYPNFMPSYLYSVHPQTGFVYPMQPWQPEAGNTKVYGSMENILTGTIPDATTVASDIGGTFDITLLDSYLDSLFQH